MYFFARHLLLFFCCLWASTTHAKNAITIDGSTGVRPLVVSLAEGYQAIQASDLLLTIGTGLKPQARVEALINGDIDIAMASHGIDIEKITQSGLRVHRFAKVAVVIGVNQSVSVESLSHEDLCKIYDGTYADWHHLGSRSEVIFPYSRPNNEVDAEVLVANVPCFSSFPMETRVTVMNKSGQLARALANKPGAIGVTTMVRVAQSDGRIKVVALNGIIPSANSVRNGSYPLTRDMYLITHEHPSKAVKDFLAFIQSSDGEQIIINNHAVPSN